MCRLAVTVIFIGVFVINTPLRTSSFGSDSLPPSPTVMPYTADPVLRRCTSLPL